MAAGLVGHNDVLSHTLVRVHTLAARAGLAHLAGRDQEDFSRFTESLSNPYAAAQLAAKEALYPPVLQQFIHQLYVLSALYALVAVVAVATLAVSAKKGQLRFITKLETNRSDAAFWVPAWTTFLPLGIALFSGLAQGYLWSLVAVDTQASSQVDFVLWQTVIWLPLWFAGYALVVHIAFTADTTRTASSHFAEPGSQLRAPGIAVFLPSPRITNALIWSLPVVVGLVTTVPFVLANKAYNHLFYAWQAYDEMSAEAAEDFNGLVNPRINRNLASLMEVMAEESEQTVKFVRGGYIAYTFFGLLLCLASFIVLFVMFRITKRQCEALEAASVREEAGEVARVMPSYTERALVMRRYMRSFLLVTGSVFLVSGLYAVISLSIAIQPTTSQANSTKHATSTRMLAGLWSFAVVGTLVTLALLHNAIHTKVYTTSDSNQQEKGSMRGERPKKLSLRPLTMGGKRQRSDSFGSRSGFSVTSLQKDVIIEVDESDWEAEHSVERMETRV